MAPVNQAQSLPDTDVIAEDLEDFPEDYPDYYDPTGFLSPDVVSLNNKREDVRGKISVIYVVATFVVFALGFLVAILDAAWNGTSVVNNLATILPLISGIFLGTLGFVIGYYFRKEDEGE